MRIKNLIVPELNNKLLIKLSKLQKEKIILTISLGLKSNKQFKLIKNLVSFELIGNKRPKLSASLYNKQLIVRLTNTVKLESLQFLQKAPVPWKKYLESFNLFEKKFLVPSLVSPISINCRAKLNKNLAIFQKSAYLD